MTDLHYVTDEERAEEHRQFFAEMAAAGTPVCEKCYFHRLVDGICRSCAWVDPIEYANAHGRIHHGVGWTTPQWAVDQAIVALYERIAGQVERDAKTAPNACAACGIDERGHEQRWTYAFRGVRRRDHNWHPYQAPTDELRLGRMLARRNPGWQAWREINRRFYLRLPSITDSTH